MVSPSESQTCSQNFTNKVFSNCNALTYLSAYLHWTYTASNSTLSMAFSAKPTQADGWVAWAINPSSPKMLGSQTLLAYKSNGNTTVKTYNITSYDVPSSGTKLLYEVSDLTAQEVGGTITIFAKWKLPDKTEKINQVWQVGPITQGVPGVHLKTGDNLKSVGVLNLGSGGSTSPTASPAPGPGSTSPPGSPAPSNGSTPSSTSRITVGFNMGLLFSFVSVATLMGL